MLSNHSNSDDETTYGGETTITFQRGRQAPPLKAGLRLARYRLLRFLGRGGFGEVWEAEDLNAGRHIALKVLTQVPSASPEVLARFQREGQLAASLNHPRSVYVFGAEEVEGHPAIAMELMLGGTLSDQLKLRGKLPVKQAVDHILDVIEGLEAAQDVGIVHRDVKPSNCFLDGEGHVKIGDFGISKTLEPQHNLTFADEEAFVGTPAFASPEQIRGRDVDFRSDIYSLGATLFSLLAGKAPFEARNPGELLARILSEEPASLTGDGIPKTIDRIVARCMSKERERRYDSYAALRADLLPFSSRYQASVADPGRRLTAFILDEAVAVVVISTAIHALISGWTAEAVYGLLHFLYFMAPESLWGRSLGKYLMGLRVGTTSGAPLQFRHVLVRTSVLAAIFLPVALFGFIKGTMPALTAAAIAACLSTMRRQNGFAGPHEFLSGTRVLRDSSNSEERRHPRQSRDMSAPNAEDQGPAFGPYHAIRDLWRNENEALVLCFDRALRRNAWVHTWRAESPGSAGPLLEAGPSRPGRLRWLQSGTAGASNWEAFEAPAGHSYCEWVALKSRLSWGEVRTILLGLATELVERFTDRTGKDRLELSLRHIWIDPQGNSKLLDFPAFASDSGALAVAEHDAQSAKNLLHQVLYLGLTGEAVAVESLGTHVPAAPLPHHARVFAERLCRSSVSSWSIKEIRAELGRIAQRPAEQRRSARLAMIAAIGCVPLLALLFYAFGPVIRTMQLPLWQQEFERVPAYDNLMRRLEDYGNIPDTRSNKEAACKLLSWIRSEAGQSPRGPVLLTSIRTFQRERLEACRRQYPSVTVEEAMEARRTIELCGCAAPPPESTAGIWGAIQVRVAELNLPASMVRLGRGSTLIFWLAGILWVFPVALAFLWPPGSASHIFGLVVQTADGKPAGRFRCAARSFFAWLPFAAFLPLLLAMGWSGYAPQASRYWETQGPLMATVFLQGYAPVLVGVEIALASVLIGGAIYAVAYPARGVPDILAGTWLMPR
jgi:uncharacterized RDD family membrane protein YckC